MSIDSHQHFWNYDPRRDSWITEEMAILKRDFSPADLAPELAANGIDASIAVQTAQSEEETNDLLNLAASSSKIAGVVGWVDLRSPCLEQRLQFFSKIRKLCGFRHIVQSEPDDRFLLNPDFLRGVRLLHAFGYTYDILIYPKQLPAAIDFAGKLPEQRFVIDHMAKPEIKARKKKDWTAHIRAVAAHPNVFCKISGLLTEADWKNWQPADFKYYLDVVFEAFGPERLLFGSDWPVCLLAGNYRQVLQLVEEYVRSNCPAQRENVFGGNAARFYDLRVNPNGPAA